MNSLWPRYRDFLKMADSLPRSKIINHPHFKSLLKDVSKIVGTAKILKIKISNTRGKILFSTQTEETGKVYAKNHSGNRTAAAGRIISKISHRKQFPNISGQLLRDRQVLSSYLPIQDPQNDIVTGVIEIYTDVTEALRYFENQQLQIILVVSSILGLLYLALFVFVTRADKILARQHNTHRLAPELSTRFGRLLDQSANEIYIFDANNFLFTHINKGALENLGYSEDLMHSMTPWDIKPEFTKAQFLEYIEPLIQQSQEQKSFETIHERRDGSTYPVEIRLQLSREDTSPVFVAMVLDISERKKVETKLRKLSQAIEQSPNTVVITDIDNKIEYVNRKFCEMTGYNANEVITESPTLWRTENELDESFSDFKKSVNEGNEWHHEVENTRKDGSHYWASESISALRNTNGELTHYIHIQQDITERKNAEESLNYLAHYDILTDLPNRRLFKTRLLQEMKEADQRETLVALLFIDLDQFKNINDSLGHSAGDILLKDAAKRLLGCVTARDTVSRFGGDEFSLILGNKKNVQDVIDVAENIISSFSKPFQISNSSFFVTTSIGIILYPIDNNNVNELLKNADTAMYQAKSAGRNNYQFYSDKMSKELQQRMHLESILREALPNNQFNLLYQPQVNISDGTIIGLEALIRWHHPTKGEIYPDQFIPIAEETGLIIPIGNWVLREACQQAKAIASHSNPVRISVNLSVRQLLEPQFIGTVTQVLHETELDPSLLELEITESMLMLDVARVVKVLEQFAALGVSISVDDFGTGYSSLAYLKRLPISSLKIDRSFILDIPENKSDMSITQAIINLSKSLGIQTIAEGVETIEQLNFLRSNQCDIMQGFYFSRPIAIAKIMQLLQHNTPAIESKINSK